MTPQLPDLPVAERYVAPALGYGTHDRSGPWWLRSLRACWRAARPALAITCIAAALAYAVAPHEYTAVAVVSAEQDVLGAARGSNVTPTVLAARADALTRSLKHTDYLRKVLESPSWRSALTDHPAAPKFDPIDGERVAGTNHVRIRFTDGNAERARAGAESALAALEPIDDPDAQDPADIVERKLRWLIFDESRLKKELEEQRALEAGAAIRPLVSPTTSPALRASLLAKAASRSRLIARQLAQATSQRLRAENELAAAPRVRRVAAATTPRLASNQAELLSTAAAVAGVAFPLAFVLALYHSWRYGRAATAQVTTADRFMSAADLATLVLPSLASRRRLGAMLRPAGAFAIAAALIVGGIAYGLEPRRYSATATLAAPPSFFAPVPAVPGRPSGAAATLPPAMVYAVIAEAANSPNVWEQVAATPQWKLVRGTNASFWADRELGSHVDVHADGQSVSITFTDAEPEAARFGADALMTAIRNAVAPPPNAKRGYVTPYRSKSSLLEEYARLDVLYSVVRQLPAATVTGANWPSNTWEIATTAALRAAQAFGVAFMLAIVCLYLRARRVASKLGEHEGSFPLRTTLGRAAVAAACVGLVAYAVVPRTYSATATLRVQAGEADGKPAPMSVVARIGEAAGDIAYRAAVKTFPERAEIEVTYSASDPHAAAAATNRQATLVATTWRDRTWERIPLDASKSFADAEAVRKWSEASRTVRLEAASLAKAPRWSHQAEPLGIAALAATAAFVVVLSAVSLRRRAAYLSSDRVRRHSLDFDAMDDEEAALLHIAGK